MYLPLWTSQFVAMYDDIRNASVDILFVYSSVQLFCWCFNWFINSTSTNDNDMFVYCKSCLAYWKCLVDSKTEAQGPRESSNRQPKWCTTHIWQGNLLYFILFYLFTYILLHPIQVCLFVQSHLSLKCCNNR